MGSAARLVGPLQEHVATILDPYVGILGSLDELERPPGAPDFIHYRAHACDTGAFGGERNRQTAAAAGTRREEAAARATFEALARYSAALYDRAGLPLATFRDATFPCVEPTRFNLYSEAQYRRPGFPFLPASLELPLRWAAATDFANGETVHVPAALVWLPYRYTRNGGDLPIAPPNPVGLACRPGVAAAALAGLYDVVAHDAAALFWQATMRPPQVAAGSLPDEIRGLIRRFEATGDRVVILDLATDNRLPAFAAALISEQPGRPAHVFSAAASLDPAEALSDVLEKLATNARLAAELVRKLPPVSPTNEWEDVIEPADHLSFAADHANRGLFTFAFSSEDRRPFDSYDNEAVGEIEADLGYALARVLGTGTGVYAANLTTTDIGSLGLNVCRVLVPGYQPLFPGHRVRALGGDRLYDVPGVSAIAASAAVRPAIRRRTRSTEER